MIDYRRRPDPRKSLVGFIVGHVRYAVPITAVKEIVTPTLLTALPRVSDSVSGVADHRGEVVPIVNLRARFGLGPLEEDHKSKWILVDVRGKTVGLAVDQVTDVFGTGGEDLKPAPALGEGHDVRGIIGVTHQGEYLTFVLDVDGFHALVAPLADSALLESGRP